MVEGLLLSISLFSIGFAFVWNYKRILYHLIDLPKASHNTGKCDCCSGPLSEDLLGIDSVSVYCHECAAACAWRTYRELDKR
jgi:hypothetical protein